MGKKTAKNNSPEIDEHDLPTEPVQFVATPPQMDTIPAVPSQQQITLRPPQQPPSYPAAPNAPKFDVYPYRPPQVPQPASAQQPYVGTQPPISTKQPTSPAQQSPFYRNLVPICIGLCFICLQMLLLARFVLKLLGIVNDGSWASTIYALCDIVLLPFQAVLPPLQLPALISARVEPYTLLAIFVYGIISRMTVHLLKLLLRTSTRQPGAAQNAK